MATFAKINAGAPVKNGEVTIATGGVPVQYDRGQQITDPSGLAQMQRLDTAYKQGGSDGWERPGGPSAT